MMNPIFYKKKRINITFWIKWISTIGACGCALASSLDMYPLNVWLGCLAGIGWVYIGSLWKEPSIILINVMMTIIYSGGIIKSMV